MISRRLFLQSAATGACLAAGLKAAQAEEAPGVTDKEIKFGQTIPYSGPASAYGVVGRVQAGYFRMINEQGGIAGRKLVFLSLDDGYSPPKTVEQTRRLVEQEGVAFLFNSLGTPTQSAVRQYLNDNKVPQIFVASGADTFADPQHFPWTIPLQPSYQTEARIYGKHILATKPDAKIAVLYQNDGFGKDYLIGLKAGLGADRAGMIVKEASYETLEPTIDAEVVTLMSSGADVLLIAATAKFAAQAVRKSSDLGWDATRYLSIAWAARNLKAAGLDRLKGVIAGSPFIDVADPRFKDDPGVKSWKAFADKYMSETEFADSLAFYGFGAAATLIHLLGECGEDFSRENIMRQAANLKDFHAPNLLPGVMINTSPTNYIPIRRLQLSRFNGESWEPLGEAMAD